MSTDEKPHLSHSQIETFTRCARQWYYRYVEGIKQPPGVAAVIGKGTHEANFQLMRQQMEWGVPMSLPEVHDVARDAAHHAWEREEPMVTEEDPTKGEAVDTVVGLVDLYARQVAPNLKPVALEQGFELASPDLPFTIVGVVDVETETEIRDTKTKGRKPEERAARRSHQLALYSLHAAISGQPHKRVALDYLVKTKTPAYYEVEATPTDDDYLSLMRRIETIAHAIETGVFVPADPMSWVCSARHCGYYDRCDQGARKAVSVGLVDPRRLTARLIPRPGDDDTEGDAP